MAARTVLLLASIVVCCSLRASPTPHRRGKHALLPYNEFLKTKRVNTDCPCSDASLCDNVKTIHNKELFGFASGSTNVSHYNWTYVTTIAWAPVAASDFMCAAHERDVRLIAGTSDIPLTDNTTTRATWIAQTFSQVAYHHFDGVTFDLESPMLWSSAQSQQYTALVSETTAYFHAHMPGSQTSVCVAWQAYLTDGRQYDYAALASAADLVYVMDYDTQSQNYAHQCLAAANAPFAGTQRGVDSYLDLGIDARRWTLYV